MRQRDCKNYIDVLYEKNLVSDIIPGLSAADEMFDREGYVRDLIYGKNLNRQALPVPEMVIPIIRNFQIKEDLFRRMKDSGIASLLSMNAGVFYGTTLDNDTDGPILKFTYTLELTASLEAIDDFINSLQDAYKTDRVYEITDIRLFSSHEELINANSLVAEHVDFASGRTAVNAVTIPGSESGDDSEENADQAEKKPVVSSMYSQYDLTDPHNPDYGRVLIGGSQDGIRCTIVVNYLFYRADNITPQ
jgi:hypothetical protein